MTTGAVVHADPVARRVAATVLEGAGLVVHETDRTPPDGDVAGVDPATLDVAVADADGLVALTGRVRAVVLLDAWPDGTDPLAAGADAVLPVPCAPLDLLAVVEELLAGVAT